MKILEVSNYFPEHHGGIEMVAQHLVERWRTHHEVRWIACDVTDSPHRCADDDVPLASLNFTEAHLGFPYPIPLGDSTLRIWREVARCDIVHVHDSLYAANLVACLACRLLRRPLVVTQHVALVPYRQSWTWLLQRLAYAILGRPVLQSAGLVIFVSPAVLKWFEPRIRFRSHPVLIANGVDHRLFHPRTDGERLSGRSRLGVATGESLCLFVGRFTEKKGLDVVRGLATARPGVRWILIGQGELDPRSWNLTNAQVVAPMAQEDLFAYYCAADLLVLPSVGEGFPLVAQEALSCGLPVAVSSETAASSPETPLLPLEIEQPSAALQAFDRVLAAPDELHDMSTRAAEFARRWDWNAVASRYEALLRDLVSSSSQTKPPPDQGGVH